jgi:hypothetical protein
MATNSKGGLIFVACGQVTAEEKNLGNAVCDLVRELTSYEPYFAEQQSTLEAFTKNILGSLNRAVGLVAIMHPRGTVKFPDGSEHARASVWIEQEIGIATFITQIIRRPVQVAAFLHCDIRREGMRAQLQLNPILFTSDFEVLERLRTILPMWKGISDASEGGTPMNPYESFRRGVLEKAASASRWNGQIIVKPWALSVEYEIPCEHVKEELAQLSDSGLIRLAAWDGISERPYDAWPDADAFFEHNGEGGNIRIRLLSSGGEWLSIHSKTASA